MKKPKYNYLTYEQVIYIIKVKEVLEYILDEDGIETLEEIKEFSTAPFKRLDELKKLLLKMNPTVINDKIFLYSQEIKQLDFKNAFNINTYHQVRDTIWNYLSVNKKLTKYTLEVLVHKAIEQKKSDPHGLGEFIDSNDMKGRYSSLDTARKLIQYKMELPLSTFNKVLKKALDYNPKKK